jgi:hypothetical protein
MHSHKPRRALACLAGLLASVAAFAQSPAPSPGITVRAGATLVANVGAQMALRVNGDAVAQVEVRSTGIADYRFPNVSVPQGARVDVVFTNDFYGPAGDRNLIVDSIVVNGRAISATAPGVVYDRGTGAQAFDGLDVHSGTKTLYRNGALRFNLASLVTPPPPAQPTPVPVDRFSLTTSISGSGSVAFSAGGSTSACSTTCTQSFTAGLVVALVANPSAGYTFAGWSGACSGLTNCSVGMTSAKTVAAVFNALPATGPLVQWQPPRTLANGAPATGLTGYKVYASKTRYDLAPALVKTVTDPAAQSTVASGLASGTWHFWVSATSSSAESELHYNSTATVP